MARMSTVPGICVSALLVGVAISMTIPATGQSTVTNSGTPTTPWGHPDLQGIWEPAFETPVERPAAYGSRELLTDQERADLMARRSTQKSRDDRVFERGSEQDVNGGYNVLFNPRKPVG